MSEFFSISSFDLFLFSLGGEKEYQLVGYKDLIGSIVGNTDQKSISDFFLADDSRFKMTFHTEERSVVAYSLVAAKPKMKKADPASRTSCKTGNAPAGSPPGSRLFTCQNITMEQFADQLQNMAPALNWPVVDATEIAGGWDFTLTFSQNMMMMNGMMMNGAVRGGDAGPPGHDLTAASDPSGAITIFDAVEKQLGLKLEKQKRSMPVIVIDHLEEKATEN